MKVFGSSYVSTKTKFKRVVNALSICIKRCKLVAVALFIISWQDEREHCRWFIDCQLGWSVGGGILLGAPGIHKAMIFNLSSRFMYGSTWIGEL